MDPIDHHPLPIRAGYLEDADGSPAVETLRRALPMGIGSIPANEVNWFRQKVTNTAQQVANNNGFVSYGIDVSSAYMLGPTGLTLTPRPNARALGITQAEADALAIEIKTIFDEWAGSTSSDVAGRQNFHQQVATALRRWWDAGEMLLEWRWNSRATGLRTQVRAIDPERIARNGVYNASLMLNNGVETDIDGKIIALWILPLLKTYGTGILQYAAMPDRVPVMTPWGRPKLSLITEPRGPGALRGISPIASALVKTMASDRLGEYTLKQMQAQAAIAWSIVTADGAPPEEAVRALSPDDRTSAPDMARVIGDLADWFDKFPVKFGPETVSVLPPGSKLTATSGAAPGPFYGEFQKTLLREIARGFGLTYAELTGDFSSENFSSSRMGQLGPWSLIQRRRANLIVPAYATALRNVVEDAVDSGRLRLPRGIDFYTHTDALLNAEWRGPSRPSPDPLKEANADAVNLENGATTLAAICAARGEDWRDVLRQRAAEFEEMRRLGLPIPAPKPITTIPSDPAKDDQNND